MSEGYGGFRDMGSVLFGGADTRGAYNKGAQGAAELETLLAKARMAKDQAMKRAEFRRTLEQNGVPPQQAAILDAAFGSDYNPEQLSGYQSDQQKMGLTGEAADLARGGNVDAMNNILTVITGKPRERTNIQDKTMFDPYAPPDQSVQTTPMGLADIVATQALGRERDAGAAAKYASGGAAESLSDLRDRTNPNLRVGSGGKGQAPVLLEGQPPSGYVPQTGDVSLESILRADGLSPDIISQIGLAAESGKDFAVTVPPAGRAAAAVPGKFTQADALQALKDAREAIKRGLLTPAQAKKRLQDAGMTKTAEFIQ